MTTTPSSATDQHAGASTRAARRDWNRAYASFPGYAADHAFPFIAELFETYPGERVFEVGFGSGMNLKAARERGWEVAGCDVADMAIARGREELPGADLRQESIVDCTAESGQFDLVIDRGALICLTPREINKAIAQIRRIIKPGGVLFFNPYGVHHTLPFQPDMPPAVKFDEPAVRRLLPDARVGTFSRSCMQAARSTSRPARPSNKLFACTRASADIRRRSSFIVATD